MTAIAIPAPVTNIPPNDAPAAISKPKITLYTNVHCPFAQRVHIALEELGLEHERVEIDLRKPREAWYLEVNPLGLVPALTYNTQTLTESAHIVHFLASTHASALLPASTSTRDRIAHFTHTWTTHANAPAYTLATAPPAERAALATALVATVAREIEPLLADAAPFFGGSASLTLAEVVAGPEVLRLFAFSREGLIPGSVGEGLAALPMFSKWAAEVRAHQSVRSSWDEEVVVEGMRGRVKEGEERR